MHSIIKIYCILLLIALYACACVEIASHWFRFPWKVIHFVWHHHRFVCSFFLLFSFFVWIMDIEGERLLLIRMPNAEPHTLTHAQRTAHTYLCIRHTKRRRNTFRNYIRSLWVLCGRCAQASAILHYYIICTCICAYTFHCTALLQSNKYFWNGRMCFHSVCRCIWRFVRALVSLPHILYTANILSEWFMRIWPTLFSIFTMASSL